jgi:autoinducer 2 (AI-2) kinase
VVFEKGRVKADIGAPPGKADLTLQMKAKVFDGMMTGKLTVMDAALSGRMKISGGADQVLQMHRIQQDILRLYIEARHKIGGPGDLSHLSPDRPGPAESIASPLPASSPAVPPRAVAPLKIGSGREELAATVRELYERDLITATGGNLSLRVPGRSDELWITPSAMFKGYLSADIMVRINLRGEALDEHAATPSSERWVYTEILRRRPDVHAVIHTHAPWATVLALTETPFLPISAEAAFLGNIPLVLFIMPGTRELAEAVASAIGERGMAVLMQNHGLVVAGSSLRRAANATEVVERCAELILRWLSLGKQLPTLPPDAVESLRERGQMMA